MGNNIKDYNHREIVVMAALRDHRTVMQVDSCLESKVSSICGIYFANKINRSKFTPKTWKHAILQKSTFHKLTFSFW